MKKTTILAALIMLCFTFMAWSMCEAKKPPPKPDEVDVYCINGDSVAEALEDAPESGRFTINVHGVCTESVTIRRNDVTLQGINPANDGFQAPSSDDFVLNLQGADRIHLKQLSITGGNIALHAYEGASFEAEYLHISGAHQGVATNNNASGTLKFLTIDDCDLGVRAVWGGSVRVIGSLIDNSETFGVSTGLGGNASVQLTRVWNTGFNGLHAEPGGSISVEWADVKDSGGDGAFAIQGGSISIAGGSLIQNNNGGVGALGGFVSVGQGVQVINNAGSGVFGHGGAFVGINGAIIEGNGVNGVDLRNGSFADIAGGAIIQGNTGDGIHLSDTSTVRFSPGDNQINNNRGWGINCEGALSEIQISGSAVSFSDNDNDGISCAGGGTGGGNGGGTDPSP